MKPAEVFEPTWRHSSAVARDDARHGSLARRAPRQPARGAPDAPSSQAARSVPQRAPLARVCTSRGAARGRGPRSRTHTALAAPLVVALLAAVRRLAARPASTGACALRSPELRDASWWRPRSSSRAPGDQAAAPRCASGWWLRARGEASGEGGVTVSRWTSRAPRLRSAQHPLVEAGEARSASDVDERRVSGSPAEGQALDGFPPDLDACIGSGPSAPSHARARRCGRDSKRPGRSTSSAARERRGPTRTTGAHRRAGAARRRPRPGRAHTLHKRGDAADATRGPWRSSTRRRAAGTASRSPRPSVYGIASDAAPEDVRATLSESMRTALQPKVQPGQPLEALSPVIHFEERCPRTRVRLRRERRSRSGSTNVGKVHHPRALVARGRQERPPPLIVSVEDSVELFGRKQLALASLSARRAQRQHPRRRGAHASRARSPHRRGGARRRALDRHSAHPQSLDRACQIRRAGAGGTVAGLRRLPPGDQARPVLPAAQGRGRLPPGRDPRGGRHRERRAGARVAVARREDAG